MKLKKLWLTYSWLDNEALEVDRVAQELRNKNLNVVLDRWHIAVGQSLWQQIEQGICNPAKSDAWAIYATEQSLRSPACREELDWALNRALAARDSYPIIGIFPGPISNDLIPAAIKVRRYVSLEEPEWLANVVAGVEGVTCPALLTNIPETYSAWHVVEGRPVLELRPRTGVWNNFTVMVPGPEKDLLHWVSFGGPNFPVRSPVMNATSFLQFMTPSGPFGMRIFPHDQVTPTRSTYVYFGEKPSAIIAGTRAVDASIRAKYILQPNGVEQVL